MKKTGILNRYISIVLSKLGHTDTIIIADCGLPIPDDTICIDVSLHLGEPPLWKVLEELMEHIVVEKITMATEMKTNNLNLHDEIITTYSDIEMDYMSHDELKACIKNTKAVIRTGEATPYANVILQAGVIF
ncbi:D-ribose pyranase [Virgibacillus proomii]|uniref:D-ribose pyranase n=1 Tax=Virgibacillus proomii TaxID=84407 RepID=UPI000987C38F|nr:D-ribose pyranase [Virgibacillus proomii]